MTEQWFVYDVVEGDYNTFGSERAARRFFEALLNEYKEDAIETGEFFVDVGVHFGRVHRRAELRDVEPEPDCPDECVVLVVTDLETDALEEVK